MPGLDGENNPLVIHGRKNLETNGWFKDEDGMHTILSGSVDDERLNNGKPTVIPFVYEGRKVGVDEAIERAVTSGIQWPSANTHEEATAISKAASSAMDRYLEPRQYKITAPDGKSYVISGPPGSTQEQALQKAMEQYARTRGDAQLSDAARRLEMAQGIAKANPDVYGNIVAQGEPEIDPHALQRGPALPADKANFGASVKAGVIADPDTQRREIAKSLFPDDPNGAQRIGFMDGSPVYVDEQGQLKRVSPRIVSGLAEITANVPEAVGAVVGSFATGNPVSGAAAGGAGGRAAKRAVSELVFDEPATPLSVGKEMVGEVAVNLVAGGLGKGVAGFAGRGKIVDFSPQNVRTAEQARQYVKQSTGIDLDLAQASGDRKLLALRDYAARYPGRTAELIQAADEAAAGQLDNATNRVLDSIAKSTPSEIAGKEGINAAQIVIRAARDKTYKEVKPLYDAAYAAVPEVTDPEILKMLELPHFDAAMRSGKRLAVLEGSSTARVASKAAPEQQIASASSQADLDSVAKALKLFDENPTPKMQALEAAYSRRSKELRAAPAGQSQPASPAATPDAPSLRDLDYLKRGLDDQIESLRSKGKRQEAAALSKRKNEMVAKLDELSNDQWKLARQKYQELIRANVEPLENGIVGVLAGIKDPLASRAAVKIFSDPNVTPAAINLAKTALEKQSPEAYAGLVRQYLAHRWNQALKTTQGGDIINPAGKFRQAVYGTPADRDRMRAMLPAGAGSAFDDLMLAMEKLSRTQLGASRVAGSNTFRDQELNESLKGQGAIVFRWLTSPRKSIQDAAEERAKQKSLDAITEALLDPAKRSQLRQVARMEPSTKQAILLSGLLSGQAVADIAPERMPALQ
jgi:hypothetical protein